MDDVREEISKGRLPPLALETLRAELARRKCGRKGEGGYCCEVDLETKFLGQYRFA